MRGSPPSQGQCEGIYIGHVDCQECLADAFAHRRQRLGVSPDTEGAVLFDKFTGNEAAYDGLELRRQVWSARERIRILEPILGGGSAKHQPCDAVHGVFRHITACVHLVSACFFKRGSHLGLHVASY